MQKPMSNTTYVFAAGGKSHSSYADCPFRVTKDGKVYASSGQIGCFTIDENGYFVNNEGTQIKGGLILTRELLLYDGVIGAYPNSNDITLKSNTNVIGDIRVKGNVYASNLNDDYFVSLLKSYNNTIYFYSTPYINKHGSYLARENWCNDKFMTKTQVENLIRSMVKSTSLN